MVIIIFLHGSIFLDFFVTQVIDINNVESVHF